MPKFSSIPRDIFGGQRPSGISIRWDDVRQTIGFEIFHRGAGTVASDSMTLREFFDVVGIKDFDCRQVFTPWSVTPAARAAAAEEVARQSCLLPLEYDPEARGEHQ